MSDKPHSPFAALTEAISPFMTAEERATWTRCCFILLDIATSVSERLDALEATLDEIEALPEREP